MLRSIVFLFSAIVFFSASLATAQTISDTEKRFRSWACDEKNLNKASARLSEINLADQKARTSGEWTDDVPRRVEVSEIYARGCIQRGSDFHRAALIFQHGNSPEHYFQAWFFASRAVALGHQDSKWLIPRAIDRYFMSTGHKQLFGTSTVTPYFLGIEGEHSYFCLWPVEDKVSDELRIQYGLPTMSDKRARVELAMPESVGFQGAECPITALSPPTGIFPGVW